MFYNVGKLCYLYKILNITHNFHCNSFTGLKIPILVILAAKLENKWWLTFMMGIILDSKLKVILHLGMISIILAIKTILEEMMDNRWTTILQFLHLGFWINSNIILVRINIVIVLEKKCIAMEDMLIGWIQIAKELVESASQDHLHLGNNQRILVKINIVIVLVKKCIVMETMLHGWM